jgi:hypothetical protein
MHSSTRSGGRRFMRWRPFRHPALYISPIHRPRDQHVPCLRHWQYRGGILRCRPLALLENRNVSTLGDPMSADRRCGRTNGENAAVLAISLDGGAATTKQAQNISGETCRRWAACHVIRECPRVQLETVRTLEPISTADLDGVV